MNDPRFGPLQDAQSSKFLQQSHEYPSDNSIPTSHDEILSNLNKLDRDKLIELLFRQREIIQGLEQRLAADRRQMTDQLSKMTENYNNIRYRHKLKEIRVQEVMAQLKQFKDNHAPCYSRLRDCLMDPGLNRVFEKMKEQVEECRRAKEEALNDMQAWTFTSESQTGKRLIARCKKLLQENEEFNKQVTSGNIAKLNAEIETHKHFIQNLQNRENDYDALLVEMDEELDAVTSLCKAFEYKLKAKPALVDSHEILSKRSLADNGDGYSTANDSQRKSLKNTSGKTPLTSTQREMPEIEATSYEFVEIPLPDVSKRTESVHNGSKAGSRDRSKPANRAEGEARMKQSKGDAQRPDGSCGAKGNCVGEGKKRSREEKPAKLNDAYKDEMASFGPSQIAREPGKSALTGHSAEGLEVSRRDGGKKQKKNGSKVDSDQSNLGNEPRTRKNSSFRGKEALSAEANHRPKHKVGGETAVPRAGNENEERHRSPRLRRKLSRTSRSRETRPKTRRICVSPPRYRSDYRNPRRRSNSRNRR